MAKKTGKAEMEPVDKLCTRLPQDRDKGGGEEQRGKSAISSRSDHQNRQSEKEDKLIRFILGRERSGEL